MAREVETLDVAPEDQVCDSCGVAYAPMSNTDNSEILEYFTKAHIREIRRKKFAKTCNCRQTPAVVTAKPAPRVIAKGLLGVSVWVEILLSKYWYSRSTCNLLRQMRDQGMAISQGTVTDGLKKMAPLFEPLLDQLMQRQMEDSVFHCDETGWKVYEKMEGKIGSRWYLWVFESTSSVIYRIEPTRSGDVPIEHFSSLSEKLKEVFVICDRYSGYKRLAKVNAAIILAFCWVHMRRDYLEAAVQYPQLERWMFEWRERIGEIYHLNARRQEHFDESRPLARQSESFMRQQQRLEHSVEQMERTLKHELSTEQMHPAQLKVLSSLQNHWSGLMVFLKHPQVALDNKSGERKMRNPAMLRKNCRGSGSHWSASLAAQMFSIIQSVLLWDLNPHRWLYEYLSACAANGGPAPENPEAFIPWRMSEARRAEMSQPSAAVSQRSSLISKCEAAVSTQRGCLSTVSQPP